MIAGYVKGHVSEKSFKQLKATTLKLVYIGVSNANKNIFGSYHKIKGHYLQNYLSNFCCKLNRRYFGTKLFDALTLATAKDLRLINRKAKNCHEKQKIKK